MKFQREDYSDALVSEIIPLLKNHYDEISDKFYGPLNPDMAIYKAMHAVDALRIFTMRLTDTVSGAEIVMGYQIFFLGVHPHSKESYEATQDIIYLAPEARKGLMGYRFLKWCTEQLSLDSVRVVHQRISAKHNFGRLFERMGFELEDLTYSKILQEVA